MTKIRKEPVMGSMVWKDDKFGDILLESREDGIKLRKLFGLKDRKSVV